MFVEAHNSFIRIDNKSTQLFLDSRISEWEIEIEIQSKSILGNSIDTEDTRNHIDLGASRYWKDQDCYWNIECFVIKFVGAEGKSDLS